MEDPKDTIIDTAKLEADGETGATTPDPKETTMETLQDDTVEAMRKAAELLNEDETPDELKDTIVESSEDPDDKGDDEDDASDQEAASPDDLKQTIMPTSRDHVDAMYDALGHGPKEGDEDSDK